MPAGRPTKYSEEILLAAQQYLDGGYLENGDVVPQIAGLACHLKISRETVRDWASHDDKPEFSGIVSNLMAEQERGLLNGGLRGDYNASLAKLALSKHGYTDKIENTLQGPEGGPIDLIIEAVGNGPSAT